MNMAVFFIMILSSFSAFSQGIEIPKDKLGQRRTKGEYIPDALLKKLEEKKYDDSNVVNDLTVGVDEELAKPIKIGSPKDSCDQSVEGINRSCRNDELIKKVNAIRPLLNEKKFQRKTTDR